MAAIKPEVHVTQQLIKIFKNSNDLPMVFDHELAENRFAIVGRHLLIRLLSIRRPKPEVAVSL